MDLEVIASHYLSLFLIPVHKDIRHSKPNEIKSQSDVHSMIDSKKD